MMRRRPGSAPGSPAHWPRHAIMIVVSFLMLIPFYWVLKTSLTGENIYAWPPRIIPVDPHLFNYVDVWYMIPLARYMLNSVIVSPGHAKRIWRALGENLSRYEAQFGPIKESPEGSGPTPNVGFVQ